MASSLSPGRGTFERPRNRFDKQHTEADEHSASGLWSDDGNGSEVIPLPAGSAVRVRTTEVVDASRSILAENTSPDIPFRFSVNPYRGCEHGCIYCYARPSHEMLGFDAGLDFETRIQVKHNAPALLRAALARPSWQPETIALSGNTDCYQPLEDSLRLTRACLEILAEARNPTSVITKSALVTRDLDVLGELARHGAVQVRISLTTLDPALARKMEPRAASPGRRLDAISRLRSAGIPVGVMIAPVVPGLTDEEIPALLRAARGAGAGAASWTLLRLPPPVDQLFADWLERMLPERRQRILSRIRATREGALSDSTFGRRMRGNGIYAEQIGALFRSCARRAGLDRPLPALDASHFRRPSADSRQLRLF